MDVIKIKSYAGSIVPVRENSDGAVVESYGHLGQPIPEVEYDSRGLATAGSQIAYRQTYAYVRQLGRDLAKSLGIGFES